MSLCANFLYAQTVGAVCWCRQYMTIEENEIMTEDEFIFLIFN
jgi:hypothetical protein